MSTHTRKSEAEVTADAFREGRLTDVIGGPPRVSSMTFQSVNKTVTDARLLSTAA